VAAAIDAVVLIHALGVAMRRIGESHLIWEQARASHHLVEEAREIRMSAVAWFEVTRGMDRQQFSAISGWRSRIHIQPLDGRTAQRAAELYRGAWNSGKICERCLGFLPAAKCAACGSQGSRQQRENDILIVAASDVDSAHDTGMQALGQFVSGVRIIRPPRPPAEQLPLASPTPIAQVNAPHKQKTKTKKSKK
jgi:hypothetical protein